MAAVKAAAGSGQLAGCSGLQLSGRRGSGDQVSQADVWIGKLPFVGLEAAWDEAAGHHVVFRLIDRVEGDQAPALEVCDREPWRLHVPNTLALNEPAPELPSSVRNDATPGASPARLVTEADRKAMERHQLEEALKACRGRVSGAGGAAERLGVKPTTLYSRIKRFEIDIKQFK